MVCKEETKAVLLRLRMWRLRSKRKLPAASLVRTVRFCAVFGLGWNRTGRSCDVDHSPFAADRLGVSVKTLNGYVRKGELRYIVVGRVPIRAMDRQIEVLEQKA